MVSGKIFAALFFVAVVFAALCFNDAEATYRKPPFNGSIFGKRGSAPDTLSALCEVASEACQAWFPSQDK